MKQTIKHKIVKHLVISSLVSSIVFQSLGVFAGDEEFQHADEVGEKVDDNSLLDVKNEYHEAMVEDLVLEEDTTSNPNINTEKGIKEEKTLQIRSQFTVRSEVELRNALSNPETTEILIGTPFIVSSPLHVNHEVNIGGAQLTFNQYGSFVISNTGVLIVSHVLGGSGIPGLNIRGTTLAPAALTVDGGRLVIGSVSSSPPGIQIGGDDGDNFPVAIEVKNGGIINNRGYLRITDTSNPDNIGIKLNNGIMNETPTGSLTGYIRTGRAIVSESGENAHNFNYSGLSGANTYLLSAMGNPVYTNYEEATLAVSGTFSQLAMWDLQSETSGIWGEVPDYAVGEFEFSVSQIGHERPTLHSINNIEFSYFFNHGIFPWFRALRSASATEVFPPMILPDSISVSPEETTIPIEGTKELVATLTPDPSQLDNSAVHWFSSDELVANVDQTGLVTGTGLGEALITAQTVNGLEATSRVRVEEFTFSFEGTEENATAIVTGYLGSNTNIEIPSEAINYEAGWSMPVPVTEIGNQAFTSLGLKSVSIPDSIIKIRNGSFGGNELTSLSIPDSVLEIDAYAFARNQLENLKLGASIVQIGANAFEQNSIGDLIIPDSVKRMGASTFQYNQLKNVSIGEGLSEIPGSTFFNNKIESIDIPENISIIGSRAFSNNELSEMIFHSFLVNIGNNAFTGNTSLKKVTFLGGNVTLGSGLFYFTPLERVVVKEEYIETFRSNLNSVVMAGVDQLTYLSVDESRYSENTDLLNNVIEGEDIAFEAISRDRYQLENMVNYSWTEAVPEVQWYKNAQALQGKTRPLFQLLNVKESDSGTYYAVINGTKLEDISVQVDPRVNPPIPPINPSDPNPDVSENPHEGALAIRYVSGLNFGSIATANRKQELVSLPVEDNAGNVLPPMVTVQDMRPENQRNGWKLTVSQKSELINGARMILNPYGNGQNLIDLSVGVRESSLILNDSQQMFAWSESGSQPGIISLAMNQPGETGVKLEIPSGVGIGKYQMDLEWSLVNGP